MASPNNRPGWGITGRIQELAAFSAAPNGLTCLYLGTAHRQAADVLMGWIQAAGMQSRLDAISNVLERYEGETPDATTLLLGSHVDTVHNAGRFDGSLGVTAAIEVAIGHVAASTSVRHRGDRVWRRGRRSLSQYVEQLARRRRNLRPCVSWRSG
jgi:acetylornithine deacetylase/succinyl-diaminopimelate desuccinylase-like protein